jgi:hypothetical protein
MYGADGTGGRYERMMVEDGVLGSQGGKFVIKGPCCVGEGIDATGELDLG